MSYVFPPELVEDMRQRLTPRTSCLLGVSDEAITQLLTTVFFAGLETYEGDHYPVGVVFLGRGTTDFVTPGEPGAGPLPLYRWKIIRFSAPRPFAARELVKLAVTGADRRIYAAVRVFDDGSLGITGLAREGFNSDADPFVKITATRPGCLSIRSGRDRLLEYERGAVLPVGDDDVWSKGSVHQALAALAREASVDDDIVPHYLDSVGFVVREMVSHGRGGILIVSADDEPSVAAATPYRMMHDTSLASLLRLAWRIGRAPGDDRRNDNPAFGHLLRNAFLTEAERVVEEYGGLTAIDGAVVLNRDLSLVAFGVILPVSQQVRVEQATAGDGDAPRVVEFGNRGTRHRASATYAAQHPGSVVFVASEDGQVSCMYREDVTGPVRLWRVTGGNGHRR